MSQKSRTSALPSVMQTKLRAIRRRQTVVTLTRSALLGISVLSMAILVAMIADWSLTLFHWAARVALTVAALSAALSTLLVTGLLPLVRSRGWTSTAEIADLAAPQLQERWRTVASLAASAQSPTSATGRAMLQQVTSEATALGRLVEPGRAVPAAGLHSALLVSLACTMAMAAFMASDWGHTSMLLRRFWNPWANISATSVRSITGDAEVPRGETVALIAEIAGKGRNSARLTIEHESGAVDQFELQPAAENPAQFTFLAPIDRSFRYRVRAGDGQTAWHRITAVDYPTLEKIKFHVTAPPYVQQAPYEKAALPHRVRVMENSRLELMIKPSPDVVQLELTLVRSDATGEPIEENLRLDPNQDGWYCFEKTLVHDLTISPRAINSHGLSLQDAHTCRIQVVADKAPLARVLSPTSEMAVANDEVIEIKFEAHDDHGIATAELVVYDELEVDEKGQPRVLAVQPIPLGEQSLAKHVSASTQLDLNQFALDPQTNISYAIRVTDNRTSGAGRTPEGRTSGETGEHTDMGEPSKQEAASGTEDSDVAASDHSQAAAPSAEVADKVRSKTDAEASADERQGTEQSVPNAALTAAASSNVAQRASDSAPNGSVAHAGTPEDTSAADGERAATSPESEPASAAASAERPPNSTAAAGLEKSDSEDVVTNDPPGNSADQQGQPGRDNRDTPAATLPAEDADAATIAGAAGEDVSAGSETPAADPGPIVPQESGAPAEAETATQPSQLAQPSSGQPSGDAVDPQQESSATTSSTAGQFTESNRLRLKITERLTSVATADEPAVETKDIRDRVIRIEKMLAEIEPQLKRVVQREVPDADLREQYRRLDVALGEVERTIAQLYDETQDTELAFAGLQMVDIGRTHVTPARDRVFLAHQEPSGAEAHASDALQHVVRALELLRALLERYDRATREQQLADRLEETVKIYEVYVQKMQQLMREARPSSDPFARKMSVIEVDQDYLDRYAEVLTLRREMLNELGRMLADDPRLLARYLDLIKRRRTSLREQLGDLTQRQSEAATELSSWLRVDELQRPDLWTIVVDMRGAATTRLAQDAAELAERVEKQMPLVLEQSQESAARVIHHVHEIARTARSISLDTGAHPATPDASAAMRETADRLVDEFRQMESALDVLAFEHSSEEEVTTYVQARLLESRTVADQAETWARVAGHIEAKNFPGLAAVEQQRIATATELLRVEMLEIEADLQGEFQGQEESPGVPAEVVELVQSLHREMEAVTFHQAAATYTAEQQQLETAERHQASAVEGFERAEQLMDQLRRMVAAALDEYDEQDPNIADLEDPTLDGFLAQLEREPNIEAQLGIPDRPRNLRVIADTLIWQQTGGFMLNGSGEAAMQRAREAMKPATKLKPPPQNADSEMDEQQRAELANDKQLQDELAKTLAALEEQARRSDVSPQQQQKLDQMTQNLKEVQAALDSEDPGAQVWQQLAAADAARQTLQALARGEPIPDEQWNRLLSTLKDGLWQVRGKTPPADYRRSIEQYQDRIRQLMNLEP